MMHGEGKIWLDDARIFNGEMEYQCMKEGHLFEMDNDDTVTVSKVIYNVAVNFQKKIDHNRQQPQVKKILSRRNKFIGNKGLIGAKMVEEEKKKMEYNQSELKRLATQTGNE